MTLSTRAATLKKEMLEALNRELEIARKTSSNERANELKNGTRTRSKGDSFVYEFEEMAGFPPEEGVQVSFTVDEKNSKGRFLGEINSKFVFEVDEDFGPNIKLGSIITDPLFLLEKQIEILSGDGPFENRISLSSIGLADYSRENKLTLDEVFMKGLNKLQSESLNIVASNSVTYIWGPPGTGKTTTMGSIVAALACAGQKVLLVSNTNLALDTALERCLDRYLENQELLGGEMLRMGTMVKPELIETYAPNIDLDFLFERETEPLRKDIESISRALSKKKNDISDFQEVQKEYKSHLENSKASNIAVERAKTLKEDLKEVKKEIAQLKSRTKELELELSQASAKSGLGRLISGQRNPGTIRLDIDATQSKKSQADKALSRIKSEIEDLENEIAEIERKTETSIKWLQAHPDASTMNIKIEKLQKETQVDEQRITALQNEIAQKRATLLEKAKVIACTAYKPLIDKEIIPMRFDCVVVDEASMLQLPLYYCAAQLTRSRIVVAGDFRQLPPITRIKPNSYSGNSSSVADDARLKSLLTGNAFTMSGVIEKSKSGKNCPELIALRDQYRMRRAISDIVSETFYPEHTLRTIEEKIDKPTPWGNESFLFFDTSSLEPECSTVNGKSRRNPMHALVVQAIAKHLFDDGWSLDATAKKSFGIVTPYRKQSSFIEGLISSDPKNQFKGGISTVHRFQGNERDLMIIDLTKVASPSEPKLGSFLGSPDPLAPENAMWNVAISRARQHVIIVADFPTLESNRDSIIAKLVVKMKADIKIIEAKSIIQEEFLEKPPSKPRSSSGSISWFTGESFYSAFEKDLRNVKSKVFLASPFTTSNGTNRWLQHFRDLRAKEVELVALTKPVHEKDSSTNSSAIHSELEQVFNELRPVTKMHEKLAIFDQRIIWLGSLNILSHKNSSEIMVRIDSPDFAQSLIDEYQNQRIVGRKFGKVHPPGKRPKIGDNCDLPGCNGKFILKKAGISKSGKPYKAFLSCDAFRTTGCRNSSEYTPDLENL